MVFSQTGSPGIQTSFTMISFFSNVFLNLALIPLFGIYGAAAATAVSFFLRRIILKKMLRKVNGINL
ncbi:MAG: polysaccharide biosynthesis C-terminal domain-containing protein [Fibrobacterota bacterium]